MLSNVLQESGKIAKKPHRKLLTIVFITLLVFSAYAYNTPKVEAIEATALQKGIAITNNVIGVDLAKYSSSSEYKQGLYLDILPQENMRYTLEAQESTLDLYYTFVEGKLERIHVLEVQGDLQMQKSISASSLDNAKDFLKSYQNYSKNAFYGNLESMLTNVDANKNATAISRNIKLAVTAQDDSTTFRWTYTFNGIEAPDKCVALHYENGFLSYFIDKWDLYKIGTTSVNISEQKAIDIAMAHAKAYTWATVIDNKTVEDLKYND